MKSSFYAVSTTEDAKKNSVFTNRQEKFQSSCSLGTQWSPLPFELLSPNRVLQDVLKKVRGSEDYGAFGS